MNRIREVIDFLVLIESKEVGHLGVASPDQVEIITPLQQLKAICFHGVHHCVVDVGSV